MIYGKYIHKDYQNISAYSGWCRSNKQYLEYVLIDQQNNLRTLVYSNGKRECGRINYELEFIQKGEWVPYKEKSDFLYEISDLIIESHE